MGEAKLFEAKEENQRLCAQIKGLQTPQRDSVRAPVVRLGSAFSLLSSPSTASSVAPAPTLTFTPQVTVTPSPKKESAVKRRNSEPKIEAPRRKLSCFKDESVAVYDKYRPGQRLSVQNAVKDEGTTVMNGIELKAPVSHNRKKWESVQVAEPSRPRRLSRCWRRGAAPKPSSPKRIVQRRRARSRSCGALDAPKWE